MTTAAQGKPAILLVHGAWHGAWCWEKLVPELTAKGWHVIAVDLPSASAEPDNTAGMYDDARVVRACLDSIDGPVTIVAHSYGGVPATQAVADATNVDRIVYLSAFQLDEGESLAGLSGGQIPSSDTGTLPVPAEPSKHLYSGAAAEDADRAAKRLVPQTMKSFSEPLTSTAWKTVSSSYIICEQDEILPPAFQEAMSARSGRSYRLSCGHSPFLSMPAELAGLITTDAGR
ncbi:alpha/beta hydrolase [Streptomyces sp. NBC_01707]|uniref:alpha/beta hydrolase n=1 Tax=unclassified Streptomyces TaxID=2593676 RepID=UPI0029B34574|nr:MULTISPECIES: alpha/beta hydrolase [unclassified Streptomyces]MDX3771780.1 alpha/beta hydrolase [Streptomyces sp. AK08-01B]MDX3821332.1 alpha/beta hydrolase [Streptomyces sp. AK08-01A]